MTTRSLTLVFLFFSVAWGDTLVLRNGPRTAVGVRSLQRRRQRLKISQHSKTRPSTQKLAERQKVP
jgi:hypothetical protein